MSTIDERIVSLKFDNRQFEAGIKTTLGSLDGLKRGLNLDSAKKSIDGLAESGKKFSLKLGSKEFEVSASHIKSTAKDVVTRLSEMDLAGKKISLKPNTEQFQAGMRNAVGHMGGAINKLGELDMASKRVTLQEIANNVDKVASKFSGMSVVGIAALGALGAKAAIIGAQMAKSLFIDPAKSGLAEYETNLGSIQTIMANTQWENKTLGDVNNALDELNTYSDKTIYNFAEMAKNIGTFTSAGVSLDDSTAAIKGIANLAAVSGSNSQQASTAMYQLSQAMSAGKVGLEDWNSVVNAGMGGKVFQDALIETAKNQGNNVDGLIAKHGSFRMSLQEGWITTKVMNETLAKMTGDLTDQQLKAMGYSDAQIVSIQKMAKTAQDAATKIKTFSQLTNTLQEGTTSGWATSWKLIIGDFEQAKTLWTNVYKVLGGMVQKSADERNKMLGEWNKLGGRTAMIESVANVFKALMNVVNPIKDAFREIFPPMTGKRLFDITIAIRNFTRLLVMSKEEMNAVKQVFKFFFAILKVGTTIIGGILGIVSAFFGAIFSGGESVNKVGVSIGKFFENLTKAISNLSFIDSFFKMVQTGAAAFGRMVGDAMTTVMHVLTIFGIRFQTVMIYAGMHLNTIIHHIKMFAIALQGGITPALATLGTAFHGAMKWIRDFADIIDRVIGSFLNGGWQAGVEAMMSGLGDLGDISNTFFRTVVKGGQRAMGAFGEGMIEAWDTVTTRVRLRIESIERFVERMKDMAQRFWIAIEPIRTAIAKLFQDIGKEIQDVFKDVNYDDTLDLINTGLLGGIVLLFNKFVKGGLGFGGDIKDSILGNIDGMFEGVAGALEGLTGTLEAMQKNLQADTLMKIAMAIGILTVSIVVLSLIDSAALTKALIAITVMFTLLGGALTVFEKVASGAGALKMIPLAAGLTILGFAILILASAVKKLSELSWPELMKGLVGVVVLLRALSQAAALMSKNAANLIATGIGLMFVAVAVKILASAVKDFSDVSFGDMIKGLIGVSTLLGALALFTKYAKVNKGAIATGAGLILLGVALKIMASAMKDFASMDVGSLIQGLAALGIVLALLSKFTNTIGNVAEIFKIAAAMVVLGFALKIIASAVRDFGSIPLEVLAKGLIAMGIALRSITLAMRALPPNMLANAVGMVAVALAMKIMASAIKDFGGMSWEELAKGLVTVAVALGVMAGAARLMGNALPGAAAIFVMAAALAVMAPVLQMLSQLSWDELLHGLAALAGIFVVLGLAGLILAPLAPVILALGTAMAMFGLGLLSTSMALVLFAGGLVALAAAVAVAGPALILFAGAILALIPIAMMELGKGIVAFAGVIGNAAPVFVDAFTKLLMALLRTIDIVAPKIADTLARLITTLLNLLLRSVPEFVDKGMRIILGILTGIANNIGKVVTAAANIIINFLNGIANKLPEIVRAGVNVIVKFIEGIGQQIRPLLQAGADLIIQFVNGLADTIRNNRHRMDEAGRNLAGAIIDGMVGGVTDGIRAVADAAVNLGKGALQAAKDILGIKSPSREFRKIGAWSAEGMAIGLTKMSGVVEQAGADVGNSALTGLQKTMSNIGHAAMHIDSTPTIRPVLDLSAIKKDSSLISGMITPPTLTLTGSYNKAAILSEATAANRELLSDKEAAIAESGGGPTFIQYNYSPKALSNAELYRNTNNQINRAKGALTRK